jgi:predicted GTPase
MISMDLQYLSDAQGRHTAVVIPIEEWNNLTETYQDLKKLENPKPENIRRKPSDFVGCISKETAQKMISDIELSRSQWERNI